MTPAKATEKRKAWIWFKGGLNGGSWVSGFLASTSKEGGFLIERSDFVNCRVPEWRISFEEPKDETKGPEIPLNGIWKF